MRAAEAEIVERGLSAVHDAPGPPDLDTAAEPAAPDVAIAPVETADRRP